MFFKFLSVLIMTLTAYSAQALTVADNRGQVEVSLPTGWTYEKDIFGLPHVYLGPEGADRASFSITLTGIADVGLPVKDLKKNQQQYQDGRKKWAEQREFKITRFIPYSTFKNGQATTHSIGVQYKDAKNVEYLELSYFTECPDSLVHTKALGVLGTEKMKTAQGIIQTLSCGKK
jgi:hypothetical protein